MKDERFETQAEIFQALLDGKKIARDSWKINSFIHLVNGDIVDQANDSVGATRLFPSHEFLIYEPPKPKKKITLYRYTYTYGSTIHQTNFTSKNWSALGGDGDYLLLTESKEIEVDDV